MSFNPNKCLKFTCLGSETTISLEPSQVDSSLYYFSKNGIDWQPNTITIQPAEFAYCKGTNYPSNSISNSNNFKINGGSVKLSGSIMSLVDDGAGELDEITQDAAFASLFQNGTGIISISTGLLSAKKITNGCYWSIFANCSQIPKIPDNFFPAINVGVASYFQAFLGCISLKEVSQSAFKTKSVAPQAYQSMFAGCIQLTSIYWPFTENPKNGAYTDTFKFCSNLRRIYVHFSEWDENSTGWVQNIASEGIFYCPSELPKIYDDNHIPLGWTAKRVPPQKKPGSMIFYSKIKSQRF